MHVRLAIFILVVLSACHQREITRRIDSSDLQRLDFGVFSVQAPPGWTKFTWNGVDSYVGGLTNGKDTLTFDYGWYSHELSPRDVDSTHLFASDSINGYASVMCIPKTGVLASADVSIDLPAPNKFIMGGVVQDSRVAVAIFQSLRFKGGDTTRKSERTVSDFTASYPKTGKSIFQLYCSDCHDRKRDMVSIAFTPELINRLGYDSVYNILTHRSPMSSNKAFHEPDFNEWPRADIDKIVDYLRNTP